MKKIVQWGLLLFSVTIFAQVGINTTTPNAQLDIKSNNQAVPSNMDGILIPKIDVFPATNPTFAQQGMLVYLTTVAAGKQPGFYYWDNTTVSWIGIGGGDSGWKLTGNSGTNPASSFLGTIDDNDVVLKRFNTVAGRLTVSNTSYGVNTLSVNTTGSDNTANGLGALQNNTTGGFNTANGSGALQSNTAGSFNVANGFLALYGNTTGNQNVASGRGALQSNSSGSQNVANGFGALFLNTIGNNNVADGSGALQSNSTGSNNVANGSSALQNNTTGNNNLANGSNALLNNTTANNNVANGSSALQNNTTGNNNVATGYQSLLNNTTAGQNTAVGYNSLSVNTTGTNNTALGFNAGPSTNALINTTALGNGTTVTANNMVRIGNAAVTSIGGQVGWTTVSDSRFKTNIQKNVPGLDFIGKLQPVTYYMDMDAIANYLKTPSDLRDKKAEKIKATALQTGFLAQDVEKAAEELNYDFSGIDKPKNKNDYYGLRYAEFVVPLIKAVQEQQEIIKKQEKTIKSLENRLKVIEEKLSK